MNALQRKFKNMTTRKVRGVRYFIFANRDGSSDIYDERLNFYDAWMNPEAFLTLAKSGAKIPVWRNTP